MWEDEDDGTEEPLEGKGNRAGPFVGATPRVTSWIPVVGEVVNVTVEKAEYEAARSLVAPAPGETPAPIPGKEGR